MTIRMIAFASAVLSVSAWSALAQPAQMQRPSGGQMTMSAESLPEECRAAVQADGRMQNMQGMDMSGMMQNMQGMMANMSEARKGYMEAMMKMHGPMIKTGDNAEAKMMAEKVIKDQGQEITQMKEWLKKNTK